MGVSCEKFLPNRNLIKKDMDVKERMVELQNKLEGRINNIIDGGILPTAKAKQRGTFCPNCGTNVNSVDKFCPDCGCRLSMECHDAACRMDVSTEMTGVIMTDIRLLAKKYNTSKLTVWEIIDSFIEKCRCLGLNWHLLDIDNHQYEIGEATWMDYSDVLEKFCDINAIKKGPALSLFIIGGNDVIPQPSEENPCFVPNEFYDDEYHRNVYSDFYYCFYDRMRLDFLDYNSARCNVARLPLESGTMGTTVQDDLGGYLNRALEHMGNGGIDIGCAVMTSNIDWIPASREMSRNLPTERMENQDNVVLDNMYLSPAILKDMDDALRKRYYESLANADMLVFNLHGVCDPNFSGFYSHGLAFDKEMLKESRAKVLNTTACWGARYIKYKRCQSMLLTALYENDVMLYSGACVPAMGKCDNYQCDSTWKIQPSAYSEAFIACFAQYQCLGMMSSGEAFLKAKCDYYNTSRILEVDEVTLATILMFNLYGCPALYTKPNIDAIAEIQNENTSKEMYRIPFRARKKEIIMRCSTNGRQSNGGILEAARMAVDKNLYRIHEVIVERLYKKMGVMPRELSLVEQYSTTDISGNLRRGYIYHYDKEIYRNLRTHIQVSLDEDGNIRDVIQTK